MEDLSIEARFSIPEPDIQPTPISVESSPPMPFHSEQTVVVSHLMEHDDSRESFDLAIIKEKMAEVSEAIATMEPY